MKSLKRIAISTILFLGVSVPSTLLAENCISLEPGADFVSRYVWRGLMINEAPNVQPYITLGVGGFEFGTWGSSILSTTNESDDYFVFSHELDLWAGYSYTLNSGIGIGVILTDYYFPNAGIEFGNFNNHDNEDGPGAHTLEAGLTLSGPEKVPIGISAFMNVYNDSGKNTYFQLDYSTSINDIGLDLVIGATTGSTDNPDYYGADDFSLINIGCTVNKEIKITDDFSLPVFVNYTINPLNDIGYLVFGLSL